MPSRRRDEWGGIEMDELRDNLIRKVEDLRSQIGSCPHCIALLDRITHLYEVMPAEPFILPASEETERGAIAEANQLRQRVGAWKNVPVSEALRLAMLNWANYAYAFDKDPDPQSARGVALHAALLQFREAIRDWALPLAPVSEETIARHYDPSRCAVCGSFL
jgi:hypothetical protein